MLGRPLLTWSGCGPWGPAGAVYEMRARPVRDELGRQTQTWVREGAGGVEACRHVAAFADDDPALARPLYLLGVTHQVFDGAGLLETRAADFRGNVLAVRRRFATAYDAEPDWRALAGAPATFDRSAAAGALLELDAAETTTTYDALGRAIRTTSADGSVTTQSYSPGGLPEQLHVAPRGEAARTILNEVSYDVMRRRELASFGAGGSVVETRSSYDERTHRLSLLRAVRPGAGMPPLQELRYL